MLRGMFSLTLRKSKEYVLIAQLSSKLAITVRENMTKVRTYLTT